MLEKTILRKYKDKRTGEWLVGIDLEIIINDISHFLSFIDSLHTVEKELDKYNVLIENISESVENRTLYKDYILEEDEDVSFLSSTSFSNLILSEYTAGSASANSALVLSSLS